MPSVADNIIFIKSKIPSSVKLVAVSKTKPVADIKAAYKAGQRMFGENRVQEFLSKKDQLPGDIEWHLIGHLQSNKVKFIIPFVSMIHSVDSYKLLSVINAEAAALGKVVNCLLQIHIAKEETKYGFSPEDLDRILGSENIALLRNVKICGVMGMATFTSDSEQVAAEFSFLKKCFNSLKNNFFKSETDFREISMGMSGDYEIAVEQGSTMVRIGSLIFGER
jgi:pyridoxal phosphate enzyme (YggS family)